MSLGLTADPAVRPATFEEEVPFRIRILRLDWHMGERSLDRNLGKRVRGTE